MHSAEQTEDVARIISIGILPSGPGQDRSAPSSSSSSSSFPWASHSDGFPGDKIVKVYYP